MIRQKLAAPTGGGGALVTRLAASQSSQRRVHAAHSTPCLRLALLACVLGSACAVAPGVVGAQSSLPVPSRTIALDRLRAMRIAALSTPTDASVLPILADEPISAEDVAYPGPLTAPERILRAATFWSRALPVVISYLQLQASFNVRERMLGRALEPAETDALWNEAHTVGAATLKATIEQLKGFYVKTGQIIAARVDLFPTQYTDALSGLTDYLDPMPASLVRRVIQQELLTGSETFDEVRGRPSCSLLHPPATYCQQHPAVAARCRLARPPYPPRRRAHARAGLRLVRRRALRSCLHRPGAPRAAHAKVRRHGSRGEGAEAGHRAEAARRHCEPEGTCQRRALRPFNPGTSTPCPSARHSCGANAPLTGRLILACHACLARGGLPYVLCAWLLPRWITTWCLASSRRSLPTSSTL